MTIFAIVYELWLIKSIGKGIIKVLTSQRRVGKNYYVGQKDNQEIGFVALKQGKKVYIQVTYLIPDEKTREREFGNQEIKPTSMI
ncbi:hypothetical protein [Parabacteroides leei]|uniref:hypothetical protein n=1 Tax=Parabacteroides leei TaxID=2939491 RepID=UPI001E4A5FE8|nr:hypothetical protein [Parabacteroides goldsteinii]